jgi:NAD(P)-dependent dehydrogenase (short-subunit alcohol dehydrogenase family)
METIVITGANKGIGLATAREFARGGDKVYALCRTPAAASDLHTLADETGRVAIQQVDVTDPESIRRVAAAIGDVTIDVLINNAGILGGPQTFGDMDFDAWHRVIDTMMIGPFRMAQAFVDKLGRSSRARIVTISSELGASNWPYGGLYAYASAKGGVNRVMQMMAIDLRDRNIIAIPLHPGYVKTDLAGPNADITPEESGAGVYRVTKSLTMADTGKFFKWNGEIHSW